MEVVMQSADAYRAIVVASDTQRLKRQPSGPPANRWDSAATRFREDPRRALDDNLQAIASFVLPDDVLLDVGGGAGRYTLPLALRCREVINVDPSPGMAAEFEASANEAGIENARLLKSDWLGATDVTCDVSLVTHVTYFVADIMPFIEKLVAASRRRVIIGVSSTPPPNQGADLSEVMNGEPQALVPGHRELLPVLWDMSILPEVRVVGAGLSTLAGRVYATRDEAIDSQLGEREGAERDRARGAVDGAFGRLFRETPGGFKRNLGDARFMLITWRTGE
jgi:SAM-dependent methyltransferase